MAKLPGPEDIQRARMPAATPGVSVKLPDYEVAAKAAKAYGEGLASLGKGLGAFGLAIEKSQDEVDDYETKKKLLDFQLNAEMALEERKRTMPVGAQGYAEGWQNDFKGMAADFVGKNDANIPASQRAKVGLALKRIDTQLAERATRDQFAEQDRFELDGLVETGKKLQDKVLSEPERIEEMREEGKRLIELSRLTSAARHKALQKYETDVEEAYFTGLRGRIKSKADLDAFKERVGVDLPDKVRGIGKPGRAEGWAEGELQIKPIEGYRAPIRGQRRSAIEGVVVHHTAGSNLSGALEHGSKVGTGATFYIDRDGSVLQWSQDQDRMIHISDPGSKARKADAYANLSNDNTVGIEVVARNNGDVTPEQKKALDGLLRRLVTQHKIDPNKVVGHGELQGGHPFGNRESDEGSYAKEFRTGYLQQTGGTQEPDPNAPAYEGPGRTLGLSRRMAHWNAAQADWAKHVNGLSQEISAFEKHASDGQTLPDGMLEDLQRRVEDSGDQTLKTRFAATVAYAGFMVNFEKAPLYDRQRYVDEQRARFGDKMTPSQNENLKKLEEKNTRDRGKLADDPLTYTMRTGAPLPIVARDRDGRPMRGTSVAAEGPDGFSEPIKIQQLDFNSRNIDADLARRMDQARIVSEYHRVPFKAFTADERVALQSHLQKGGDGMLRVLGRIASAAANAGEEPSRVMREFTKDAPEVAVIGELVANNADRNLLATAAKALQFKASQGENFQSTIDKAQVKTDLGEYAEAVKNQPTKRDAIQKTAQLIYEYESRREGFKEFDRSLYLKIVGRVMGKVETPDGLSYGGIGKQSTGWFSSSQVLVPPGIRTDMFDDMKGAFRPSDFAYVGTPRDPDGTAWTATEVRRATWEPIGDGRYILRSGTDADGTAVVATTGRADKDGNPIPFILDTRRMMDPLRRRKPELFMGHDGKTEGIDDEPIVTKGVPRVPGGLVGLPSWLEPLTKTMPKP